MTTELLDPPMTKRNDVSVKIDAEAVASARIAAAIEGKNLAEFLSDAVADVASKVIQEFRTTGGDTVDPKLKRPKK